MGKRGDSPVTRLSPSWVSLLVQVELLCAGTEGPCPAMLGTGSSGAMTRDSPPGQHRETLLGTPRRPPRQQHTPR